MTKTKDPVRERIIANAEALFFARGFSGVTMDRMAAELGISKKTLYQHFASKHQLLYAVVSRMMAESESVIKALTEDPMLDYFQRMALLVEHISRRTSKISRDFMQDLQKSAPDMWEEINEFRRRKIYHNFGLLVRKGIRAGLIRPEVDPDLVTQMYAVLVQQMINPQALIHSSYSPGQLMKAIVELVFAGAMTEKGRIKFKKDFK
ncbi:TetR/AcrR family transcriptional regulator [candidate division TA06 bacterium]|nr:TetR/AcrR family transcriptional regulator [candidate division TA06 bacterium]